MYGEPCGLNENPTSHECNAEGDAVSRNLTRLARTMNAVLAFTSAVLCYGASDLPYIDVTALGAKNDAVQLKACSTVAGSTALACNGPYGKGFTAASVGKTIVVRGAGATLAPY